MLETELRLRPNDAACFNPGGGGRVGCLVLVSPSDLNAVLAFEAFGGVELHPHLARRGAPL